MGVSYTGSRVWIPCDVRRSRRAIALLVRALGWAERTPTNSRQRAEERYAVTLRRRAWARYRNHSGGRTAEQGTWVPDRSDS